MIADAKTVPTPAARIGSNLERTLHSLRRRILWLVGSVVLGVACAITYNQTAVPVYEAASLLLIQPQAPKVATFDDSFEHWRNTQAFYNSQYQLVRSLSVAKAAASQN